LAADKRRNVEFQMPRTLFDGAALKVFVAAMIQPDLVDLDNRSLAVRRMDAGRHFVEGGGRPGVGFLLSGERFQAALAVLIDVITDPGGPLLSRHLPFALPNRHGFLRDMSATIEKIM